MQRFATYRADYPFAFVIFGWKCDYVAVKIITRRSIREMEIDTWDNASDCADNVKHMVAHLGFDHAEPGCEKALPFWPSAERFVPNFSKSDGLMSRQRAQKCLRLFNIFIDLRRVRLSALRNDQLV